MLRMGDIDILVCDYCEAKYPVYPDYWFSCVYTENCLQTIARLIMIITHCYDITWWFLLTIICYLLKIQDIEKENTIILYVVIFEWLNLQKQFIGQYYKKIFSKIGENHFKSITCVNYKLLFSKNALSFWNFCK